MHRSLRNPVTSAFPAPCSEVKAGKTPRDGAGTAKTNTTPSTFDKLMKKQFIFLTTLVIGLVKPLGLHAQSGVFAPWAELSGPVPFIDFHHNSSTTDYNVRVINDGDGWLSIRRLGGGVNVQIEGRTRTETLELTCDRNQKQNFKPIVAKDIAAKVAMLPITTWVYTNNSDVIHCGPMAQDFKAAFGLGEGDKHIGAGDGIGVALAAIKGLHEIVQEKDSEIAALKRELAALKQELAIATGTVSDRLAALEKAMAKNVQQAGTATLFRSSGREFTHLEAEDMDQSRLTSAATSVEATR